MSGNSLLRRSVEGSTLKVIPIDSPWKNGVTERHGGIAKQILYKLVDQMSVTDESVFQMCVAAAAQAKNSLSRVCGYSPVQWVLGKEPSTAFSVLDSPHQLACHDRLLRGGKFAIQSQIREAARVAWIQLDNSDRFRRAILRNPTLQRQSFFPGEQVFIFQYGEWRGPCVVVAEQPHRILWVSFRKALLKVSLEHVRAATSEEFWENKWLMRNWMINLSTLNVMANPGAMLTSLNKVLWFLPDAVVCWENALHPQIGWNLNPMSLRHSALLRIFMNRGGEVTWKILMVVPPMPPIRLVNFSKLICLFPKIMIVRCLPNMNVG